MTSSLFATTLIASFFVVGLPHVLPCPVPAKKFADGEVVIDENGRRKIWRQKEGGPEVKDGLVHFHGDADTEFGARKARECPVPKPGGLLGEWLGFHGRDDAMKKVER